MEVNYNEICELVVFKVKIIDAQNNSNSDDTDEKKQDVRDRKQAYNFKSGLSDPKNWTKTQNNYAKQCKHSFALLFDGSLQFVDDYWQGFIVCVYISLHNFLHASVCFEQKLEQTY